MGDTYRKMVGIRQTNNSDTYSVVINYAKPDVEVSEQIPVTTLPEFISAVGGNLGLFIGFSLLPVLLKAADLIQYLKLHTKL